MKTRLILKPGQRGTKSLVKQYGDALLYVRFRYDAESRQRLKTVELVVDRAPWTPPQPRNVRIPLNSATDSARNRPPVPMISATPVAA